MAKVFSSLLSIFLLVFPLTSFAQSYYITENLSAYLRKGAGDQFKIAGTIQAGEKVTVLEQKDRYSLIRDAKNREAWILTSQLTQSPSAKEQVPQLQQQVEELRSKLAQIDNDWHQRTAEMQRRTKQAEQQSHVLLEQNTELTRELDILKNKNRELEAMQDAASREIMIQYFLYGGSVLGIGLLLGLIIPLFLPRRPRNNGWR